MRQVIYGEDARFIEWAERRLDLTFSADAIAIGLVQSDDIGPLPDQDRDDAGRKIIASVVYEVFTPYNCYMHIATDGSRRWMTKEYLVRCFAYPFIQCGLRRVTGTVPKKNTAALNFDIHLGFKLEGVCEDALPDDDIIVLGMTRKNCRFIPKEHRYGQ